VDFYISVNKKISILSTHWRRVIEIRKVRKY
jgi:hypothetical protein